MSIDFTAKVELLQRYEEQDGTMTDPFTQMSSSLDLGNYRANRQICPLNSDGCIEDCGEVIFETEEAVNHFASHLMSHGLMQMTLAYRYITALQMLILGCSGSSIRITVTWA